MNNNHDNDKIFNDYMNGDSEISRLYRYGSNEEPPKHLIDATQNRIEEMMDADMEMAANKTRSEWYVPLSIAASFVICAGVVLSIFKTSDEAIVINQELAETYAEERYISELMMESETVEELVEELDGSLTKEMEVEIAAMQKPIVAFAGAKVESVDEVETESPVLSVVLAKEEFVVAQDSGYTKEMEDEIRHRNREELEQFELDNLRMVGTVEDKDNKWGIIKDPDGAIHRVKVGNYLGRNTGKVLNVFEGRIEVREIVRNSYGRWEEHLTGIALSDDYETEVIENR